jgi:hypothetical protein
METRDEFAEMVNLALRLWGEEVTRRVRTDDIFAERLQARWFEHIAEAMQDRLQPVEDQLNEDDRGHLLVAAVVDVLTDEATAAADES